MKDLLVKAIGFTFFLGATSVMAQPIATFKGGKLTVEDYKSAVEALGPQGEMLKANEQLQEQFLHHLIDMNLIAGEAKAKKIEETVEYKAIMAATQREVLAKVYVDQYLSEQTSPEKLEKFFNENKADFSAKEVRVSHILFDKEDKDTAEKVLQEAKKKNADFNALLEQYADDPSGAKGGQLDFVEEGSLVPSFEEAAFATAKGTVHPTLVETEFGYHIIKVDDVRGGDKVTFAERKDQVEAALRSQASENLVQQLREQAEIQIDEKTLKSLQL